MRPYTALSAHRYTFGEGLLEALVQAESSRRATLLVAYDIESRGPLATMAPSRGIVGAAVIVTPTAGARSLARVRWSTVRGTELTAALPRNSELVAGNAMAACLPFFEAMAIQEDRTVRLGLNQSLSLEIHFEFPTRDDGRRP
jgi:hypothetical protein